MRIVYPPGVKDIYAELPEDDLARRLKVRPFSCLHVTKIQQLNQMQLQQNVRNSSVIVVCKY